MIAFPASRELLLNGTPGVHGNARRRLHPLARSPNSIPYNIQTNNVRKLFIFSSIFLCQRCACTARRGRSKSKPAFVQRPASKSAGVEKVRDFAFKSPFSSLAAAPLHHPGGRTPQRAQEEVLMFDIHSGQCGLCTHFGEHHSDDQKLVQIRTRHQAPEDLVEECDHPRHASLHLMVTPISGCDGFEPVAAQ